MMRANLSTLLASLLPLLLASSAVAQSPGVRWQNDLESAMHLARQTNRLILVHFWAPWCKPCVQLDREVFNQAGLARSLEMRYVPVKVNTDRFPEFARRYGVANVPTDVVLSPDGQLISRTNSPSNWQAYANQMAQIASRQSSVTAQRPPMRPERNAATGRPAPAAQGGPVSQPSATGNPYHTAGLPAGAGGTPNRQVPPPVDHPYGHMSQSIPSPQVPAMAGSPRGRSAGSTAGVSGAQGGATAYPGYPARSATAQPHGSDRTDSRYGPVAGRYGSPADVRPSPSGSHAAYPPNVAPTAVPSSQPKVERPAGSVSPRWVAPPQPGRTSQADPSGGAGSPSSQSAAETSPRGTARPERPNAAMSAGAREPLDPPLGLDGYCPVTLRTKQQWVAGDRRWGVIHRGRTYLFTTSEAQQRFLGNPDEFSPVLSGLDPVAVVDQHQVVAGQRRHGVFYGGRVYLFSSEASLQQFSGDPERYVQGVRQAMRTDSTNIGRR